MANGESAEPLPVKSPIIYTMENVTSQRGNVSSWNRLLTLLFPDRWGREEELIRGKANTIQNVKSLPVLEGITKKIRIIVV